MISYVVTRYPLQYDYDNIVIRIRLSYGNVLLYVCVCGF